jgi:hypothetical protein
MSLSILANSKNRFSSNVGSAWVSLSPTAVTVARGGTAAFVATVTRVGTTGDATWSVTGLPTGVTVQSITPNPTVSPSTSATVVLAAASDAPLVSAVSATVRSVIAGAPDATASLAVTATSATYTPNWSALPTPTLDPATGLRPDYDLCVALRTAPVGASITDPSSGLAIVKREGATPSDISQGYGGGYWCTLPDADGNYHWLTADTARGMFVVQRVHRVSGTVTNIDVPGIAWTAATNIQCAASQVDPRVFYVVTGAGELQKWRIGASSVTQETTAPFPASVATLFPLGHPAGEASTWLTLSRDDRYFCVCKGFTVTRYDAVANSAQQMPATRIRDTQTEGVILNEAKIDRSGRYITLDLTPGSMAVWDVQNDKVSGPVIVMTHYMPNDQSAIAWYGWELNPAYQAGMQWAGSWALHSGEIYVREWQAGTPQPNQFAQVLELDGAAFLTATGGYVDAGSLPALARGQGWLDVPNRRVYYRRTDGAAPTALSTRIMVSAPPFVDGAYTVALNPVTSDGQIAGVLTITRTPGTLYGRDALAYPGGEHVCAIPGPSGAPLADQRWVLGHIMGSAGWDATGGWTGGWTSIGGNRWTRTYTTSAKVPTYGCRLSADGTTVLGALTRVATLGALVDNTFHVDEGTRLVTLQRNDGITPSPTTVEMSGAAWSNGSVVVANGGMTDVRHVAWALTHPRSSAYDNNLFAQVAPDGSEIRFNSDLGVLDGTAWTLAVQISST